MTDRNYPASQAADSCCAVGNTKGGNLALWLLVAVTAGVVVMILLGNSQQTATATGPDLVPWADDYSATNAAAAASSKLVLINFTADWCPPCQQMKAQVYSQQQVADDITSKYVPLKVDMTDPGTAEHRVASRFGIEFLPTLVVTDAHGTELGRRVGYVSDAQLQSWLSSFE